MPVLTAARCPLPCSTYTLLLLVVRCAGLALPVVGRVLDVAMAFGATIMRVGAGTTVAYGVEACGRPTKPLKLYVAAFRPGCACRGCTPPSVTARVGPAARLPVRTPCTHATVQRPYLTVL